MSIPALIELGSKHEKHIRGVSVPGRFIPGDDFIAQAVLTIVKRIERHVREQSRPSVIVAHEYVARQVIAARRCCVNDGCLLLSSESCPICGTVA